MVRGAFYLPGTGFEPVSLDIYVPNELPLLYPEIF